jgi:hypothetical protein
MRAWASTFGVEAEVDVIMATENGKPVYTFSIDASNAGGTGVGKSSPLFKQLEAQLMFKAEGRISNFKISAQFKDSSKEIMQTNLKKSVEKFIGTTFLGRFNGKKATMKKNIKKMKKLLKAIENNKANGRKKEILGELKHLEDLMKAESAIMDKDCRAECQRSKDSVIWTFPEPKPKKQKFDWSLDPVCVVKCELEAKKAERSALENLKDARDKAEIFKKHKSIAVRLKKVLKKTGQVTKKIDQYKEYFDSKIGRPCKRIARKTMKSAAASQANWLQLTRIEIEPTRVDALEKKAIVIKADLTVYDQQIQIGERRQKTVINADVYDNMARLIFEEFVNKMKLKVEGKRGSGNGPADLEEIRGRQLLGRIDSWYNKAARYDTDLQNFRDKIYGWLEEIDDLTEGFDPDKFTAAPPSLRRDEIELTAEENQEIENMYKAEEEDVNRIVRYEVPQKRPFKLREAMQKNTPWAKQMAGYQQSGRQYINATSPQGSDCEQVSHVVNKYAEMTNDISDMVTSYSSDKQMFDKYKKELLEGLESAEKDIATELTAHKYTQAEAKDLKYWLTAAKEGTNMWVTDMEKQLAVENGNTLANYKTSEIKGSLRSTIERYKTGTAESDLKKYISYLAHVGTSAMKKTSVQSDMKTYGNIDVVAKHLSNLTAQPMSLESSEPHLSQLAYHLHVVVFCCSE